MSDERSENDATTPAGAAEPVRRADGTAVPAAEADTAGSSGTGSTDAAGTGSEPAAPARTGPARTETARTQPTGTDSARTGPTPTAVAPAPPAERPAPTPAVTDDAPPRRHGNRLVATFWVLFAMLLFEVGYILVFALLVLLVNGPDALGTTMSDFFRTNFITWVPVVVFGVLYELSVLLLGRAGRFAYVVASLVVGLLVWILTGQLLLLLQGHGLGTAQAVSNTLEQPEIILMGVLAREVMLWTGFAVGARGIRVRRRDRRERQEYEREHTARV